MELLGQPRGLVLTTPVNADYAGWCLLRGLWICMGWWTLLGSGGTIWAERTTRVGGLTRVGGTTSGPLGVARRLVHYLGTTWGTTWGGALPGALPGALLGNHSGNQLGWGSPCGLLCHCTCCCLLSPNTANPNPTLTCVPTRTQLYSDLRTSPDPTLLLLFLSRLINNCLLPSNS